MTYCYGIARTVRVVIWHGVVWGLDVRGVRDVGGGRQGCYGRLHGSVAKVPGAQPRQVETFYVWSSVTGLSWSQTQLHPGASGAIVVCCNSGDVIVIGHKLDHKLNHMVDLVPIEISQQSMHC